MAAHKKACNLMQQQCSSCLIMGSLLKVANGRPLLVITTAEALPNSAKRKKGERRGRPDEIIGALAVVISRRGVVNKLHFGCFSWRLIFLSISQSKTKKNQNYGESYYSTLRQWASSVMLYMPEGCW